MWINTGTLNFWIGPALNWFKWWWLLWTGQCLLYLQFTSFRTFLKNFILICITGIHYRSVSQRMLHAMLLSLTFTPLAVVKISKFLSIYQLIHAWHAMQRQRNDAKYFFKPRFDLNKILGWGCMNWNPCRNLVAWLQFLFDWPIIFVPEQTHTKVLQAFGGGLKREMLLKLARKDTELYPDDPEKREEVYNRYKVSILTKGRVMTLIRQLCFCRFLFTLFSGSFSLRLFGHLSEKA